MIVKPVNMDRPTNWVGVNRMNVEVGGTLRSGSANTSLVCWNLSPHLSIFVKGFRVSLSCQLNSRAGRLSHLYGYARMFGCCRILSVSTSQHIYVKSAKCGSDRANEFLEAYFTLAYVLCELALYRYILPMLAPRWLAANASPNADPYSYVIVHLETTSVVRMCRHRERGLY
jgi:hypothetical protein